MFQFGKFRIDPLSRALTRDDNPVAINVRAFDVLLYLVQNPGRVVTKEELLKSVWSHAHVDENNLTQSISALRKALEERPGANSFITTLPGRGYQFIAPVSRVGGPEVALDSSVETDGAGSSFVLQQRTLTTRLTVEQERSRPRRLMGRLVGGAVAIAVVALILVTVAAVRFRPHSVPPDQFVGTVVADFTNATGEATFDRSLKRAMEIELGQSPSVGVSSDQEAISTLGLMGLKPDTPLSPAIAREVCERNNRQVVLTGGIASVGPQYLLTMEATSCVTGRRVASDKLEAADKSKILPMVDALADTMRSKLGESAKSIQRNDVPLAQAATYSLEALRAYSTAQSMNAQGATEVVLLPLYQKAVELDPQFALAYEAMAGKYYELQEGHLASANFKKAFDLRDRVGENDRLGIEARYYAYGLGDAVAGLKAFRVWAGMYPHDYRPWVNIANFDNQLGNFPEAIAAGERAVQINPKAYPVTARAYKNAGRFAEAKALEARSSTQGSTLVGSNTTFEIAYYEHDQATFDRIVNEFEARQWQLRNYYLGQARSMDGKYVEAKRLMELEIDEDRKLDKGEIVDGVLIELAMIARLYGYPADAHAYLARVSRGYLDSDDAALELALSGDVTYAKRYLAKHERDQHAPTDQASIVMPRMRAVVAMQEGKFVQALADLEPSRPYEMAGFETRTVRAAIYMKVGQPGKAAADYQSIVANPGNGFGVLYPTAQLGLARAEAAAGDVAASRAAYQAFLNDWKDADSNVPVLKAAKAELARVR